MKRSFPLGAPILLGGLLLILGTLDHRSIAAPGDLDPSFDPGSGVNDEVFAIAVQSNGKIIIGGQFTTVKGLLRRGIARLNADGSGDSSFNPGTGIHGSVYSVALPTDYGVLIGGSFAAVNGTNRTGIALLHADGSLDATFNPQLTAGASNAALINSIAVQADGKLLIGGLFSAVDGTERYNLARLNPAGSLDTSFSPARGIGGPGDPVAVFSVAVQADGRIVSAGVTVTEICDPDPETGNCRYSYLYRYFVVRLYANGSPDTNFVVETDGPVYSIAPQADVKMLIGGVFTHVNLVDRLGIARLNPDGNPDAGFDPGSAIHTAVYSILALPDDKVLVGTEVTLGTNGPGIVRLNEDGTLDDTFSQGVVPDATVYSTVLHPDGEIIAGGGFTAIYGRTCNRVARLLSEGSLDETFNSGRGLNNSVFSLAPLPNGKILIGGQFTTVQNLSRPALARLYSDGSADDSFDADVAADPAVYSCPIVKSVAVQPDGRLLIGGQFSAVHGASRNRIARLHADGSLDGSFNPGTGIAGHDNPAVNAIAVQPDGRVLIGGSFTNVNGINRNAVARLNSNGSVHSSFSPDLGLNHMVNAVALQSDGKVLVGGSSSTLVNDPDSGWDYPVYNHFLTRLNTNGTRDTGFEEAAGVIGPPNSFVYAVAVQSDTKVLVGGNFSTFKGANRNGLARLNADGSLDESFEPGIGGIAHVDSIILQSDGRILIGGYFPMVSGAVRNGIARLNTDGSLDGSFDSGMGADHVVSSLALQPDGNVLLGGHFTTVNGLLRPYVARLYGDSALPSLNIAWANGQVVLSWPAAFGDYQLRENTNVSLANSWSAVAALRSTNNSFVSVALPTSGSRKFFRLSVP